MSWPTVALSEVAEIKQGGRLGYSSNDFVEQGTPAYGAGGLNGYLNVTEFDRPAVILSAIGARCGKCFYVAGAWTSLANTQLIFPDEQRVDPRFLWYALNGEEKWLRHGTGQPYIKPSTVKGKSLPLPPLPEQRRIAAILDQADVLRRLRRQSLSRLSNLRKAAFDAAFKNQERLEAVPLSDVVAPGTIVTYGIVQAGEEFAGGVPYIRTGDIKDGVIRSEDLRHTDPAIAARFDRSKVRAGEIVMSIRATVGTTAVVPDWLDGANLTQGTARISPGPRTHKTYLLEYLRSERVQQWIQRQVKGATFREITLSRLRELPVEVPMLEAQEKFALSIEALEKQEQLFNNSLNRFDSLFTSLQHRAFCGEL